MVISTKVQVPDGTLLLEPQEMYNPCLVGICHQAGNYVALYSRTKVIQALIDDGLSEDDALEHYDFNVSGSAGWGYPMFLVDEDDWLEDEDEDDAPGPP